MSATHALFGCQPSNRRSSRLGAIGINRFDWTNPHVTIYVEAEDNPAQRFKIETGSINALSRAGWSSDSIKVGEKAEVSFHPLKRGDLGGLLIEIKIGGLVLAGGG